jgi:hypothetical protein
MDLYLALLNHLLKAAGKYDCLGLGAEGDRPLLA